GRQGQSDMLCAQELPMRTCRCPFQRQPLCRRQAPHVRSFVGVSPHTQRLSHVRGPEHAIGAVPMKAHIKTAGALMIGVVLGGVSLSTLSAQTKAPAAYWVTEVLELQDQAAFMTAIQAVSPTVQQFGGRYIVLGGKL